MSGNTRRGLIEQPIIWVGVVIAALFAVFLGEVSVTIGGEGFSLSKDLLWFIVCQLPVA